MDLIASPGKALRLRWRKQPKKEANSFPMRMTENIIGGTMCMKGKKAIVSTYTVMIFLLLGGCSAGEQENKELQLKKDENETKFLAAKEEMEDTFPNENITFRVLDGDEITVSRDRLRDTGRINNRWSLEETDAMIAPLQGTWTTDEYMGYILSYNLRKFDPGAYMDEDLRKEFFEEYEREVREAESTVPDIRIEIEPLEEYENEYTISVNNYESPFSIILSTSRINDDYPIYEDTTTLSESFYMEYPVVYIKFFARFKDGETDTYKPATVIVSADNQVMILMDGAFYSLERKRMCG